MKRLSIFASLALAAALLFTPALAAVSPAGHPMVTPISCSADVASVYPASPDFAVAIVTPALDQPTCDAAMLAETGLCLTTVEPARASVAFVLFEPSMPAASAVCPTVRSPAG